MKILTSLRQPFLEKIDKIIDNNLSNKSFSITDMQTELSLSGSQIYRKVKQCTGCSPSIYIRNIRVKYAYKLIMNTDLSLSEITFLIGFNSLSYFSRSFTNYYGFSPSSLRN